MRDQSANDQSDAISGDIGKASNGRTKGPLVQLMRMQQICSHPALVDDCYTRDPYSFDVSSKMMFIKELLNRLFSSRAIRSEDNRIAILSRSRRLLDIVDTDIIRKHPFLGQSDRSARVDGLRCTDPADRQHIFRRFNRMPSSLKCLLMTTQVGGVGVTLTGANWLVILEPGWNPAVDAQASDRVHRIGQTREVTVLRLVVSNSVEEVMYRRQLFKGIVKEAALHRRHLVRFLSSEEIFGIFRQSYVKDTSCLVPDEDDPVTLRRLRNQGIDPSPPMQTMGSQIASTLDDLARCRFVRAFSDHSVSEISELRPSAIPTPDSAVITDDKVTTSDSIDDTDTVDDLVARFGNLNAAFEAVADSSKDEISDQSSTTNDKESSRVDEFTNDDIDYDLTWLHGDTITNRMSSAADRKSVSVPTDTKADGEQECTTTDLSEFVDCLDAETDAEETESNSDRSFRADENDATIANTARETPRSSRTPHVVRHTNLVPSELTGTAFQRRRDEIVIKYYNQFNDTVFGKRLPNPKTDAPVEDPVIAAYFVYITWNKRMRTSAGFTYPRLHRSTSKRLARIELAPKVVDSEGRLRETLLHEMCHVAAWLLDGCGLSGRLHCCTAHGGHFQMWARVATRVHPTLVGFQGCHAYQIHKKWRWSCTGCSNVVMRHSKSLNVNKTRCGMCMSKFRFVGAVDRNGTPMKARRPNSFALFVKEHFSRVRKEMPCASHGEVMKRIAATWAEQKRTLKENGGKKSFEARSAAHDRAVLGEVSFAV